MSRKGALSLACFFLAAILLIFEFSDLDLWCQDLFYSFEHHHWLLSRELNVLRVLLYHGPKVALYTFGFWLLLSLILPKFSIHNRFLSQRPPPQLLYLIVCLALFPISINGLKKATGLHCPAKLTRYGGSHAYRKIFSPRPLNPHEMGRCFPAGHASGGFALLSLCFVARNRQAGKRAVFLAVCAGWLMGLYQMLNGEHFLSHTLVTVTLAWIFTLSMAMLFRLPVRQSSD